MLPILATLALVGVAAGELALFSHPLIPPDGFLDVPHPGQGKCNLRQLDFCQKEFAHNLDGTVSIFKEPQEFIILLQKHYYKPLTEGLFRVCDARNEFHSCLGEDYTACTDVFNIMKEQKPSSVANAFKLADVYNDLEFDCNGGLSQGIRHWNCMQNVHISERYQNHTAICFKQYNETVMKNPEKYCEAAQGLSLCIAIIYQQFDSCYNRELVWWECERTLRRAQLDGFCDKITCSKVFEDDKTSFASREQHLAQGMFSPATKKLFSEMAQKLAASGDTLQ